MQQCIDVTFYGECLKRIAYAKVDVVLIVANGERYGCGYDK